MCRDTCNKVTVTSTMRVYIDCCLSTAVLQRAALLELANQCLIVAKKVTYKKHAQGWISIIAFTNNLTYKTIKTVKYD